MRERERARESERGFSLVAIETSMAKMILTSACAALVVWWNPLVAFVSNSRFQAKTILAWQVLARLQLPHSTLCPWQLSWGCSLLFVAISRLNARRNRNIFCNTFHFQIYRLQVWYKFPLRFTSVLPRP